MTRLRRRTVAAAIGVVLVIGPIAIASNMTSAAAAAQGTTGYEVSVPTDLTWPTSDTEVPVRDRLRQLLQAFADYLVSQT